MISFKGRIDDCNPYLPHTNNTLAIQGASIDDNAAEWPQLAPARKRDILQALLDRICLGRHRLEIRLCPHRAVEILAGETPSPAGGPGARTDATTTISLTLPVQLKRAGIETRLISDGDDKDARRRTDHSLRRLLAQGYRYREMVLRGGQSISELAAEVGVGRSYFSRILRLGFLSPDAVKAILADRHPLELTATKLGENTRLPVDWEHQMELLGLR